MSERVAGDGLQRHVNNYANMKEVVLRQGILPLGVQQDTAGLIGNFIVNRILPEKLGRLIVLTGILLAAVVTDNK